MHHKVFKLCIATLKTIALALARTCIDTNLRFVSASIVLDAPKPLLGHCFGCTEAPCDARTYKSQSDLLASASANCTYVHHKGPIWMHLQIEDLYRCTYLFWMHRSPLWASAKERLEQNKHFEKQALANKSLCDL